MFKSIAVSVVVALMVVHTSGIGCAGACPPRIDPSPSTCGHDTLPAVQTIAGPEACDVDANDLAAVLPDDAPRLSFLPAMRVIGVWQTVDPVDISGAGRIGWPPGSPSPVSSLALRI